ncbi:MAG TPA: ATP-binding protein [Candidatus Binatia bacterium]|jgi:PAS domain S-box-containing protein
MLAEIFTPDHYRATLFALPTSLTACTMLALGLIVLLRERDSRVGISFFIMTATAALWLAGYSLMYCAQTSRVAAAWSVLGHIGITLIPASVYHFTVTALQLYSRYRRRVWLVWAICAVFLATVFFGSAFLKGIYLYRWGYYPLYGWMGVLFICFFFGLMALSLREYWNAYRSALPGPGKLRSRGLLSAFCIAYLGSFDYLAALGVPLYPFGYLPVLGFIILVGRTIRRYRLVNITPELAAEEIIQAMDDALLVMDNEGIVRVANHSACRIFSRAENELEGASIAVLAQVFDADAGPLARRIVDGTLRNHEYTAHDGKADVSLSSFIMRDAENRHIATVCMIRDISEAKTAQRRIERHNAEQAALYQLNLAATSTLELRAVLNVLLERLAVLVPRTATTVLLLDKAKQPLRKVACRGINEQDWQSEPDSGRNLIHPVLRTKDVISLPELRGRVDDDLDAAYFVRHGFVCYLGLPLIAQNQVIGILSFYSPEVRCYGEEEINFLRNLAGQAAVAIHNSVLYEQTRRQAAVLEKANRVKEDFLSVMSHELRTPLNVICGYTKLVQEGMMGKVNAEQRKALDKVGRHAGELLFMVNSIMSATQIEAEALTLDCHEFLLTGLLDELKSLYDYPRGKDVRLEWDYPDDLPSLHSDSDKLKHILQNLINNALKFTDAGSVTVTARQIGEQPGVELTVADTGIGIPPEDLPTIFERFRQIDSSRTRAHGGVGLGLHIVKTFTEMLGGEIEVASSLGHGSTFTITFPRTKKDRLESDAPGR